MGCCVMSANFCSHVQPGLVCEIFFINVYLSGYVSRRFIINYLIKALYWTIESFFFCQMSFDVLYVIRWCSDIITNRNSVESIFIFRSETTFLSFSTVKNLLSRHWSVTVTHKVSEHPWDDHNFHLLYCVFSTGILVTSILNLF